MKTLPIYPEPSRGHLLARESRTQLVARYLQLVDSGVAMMPQRCIALWSPDELVTHILNLEETRKPGPRNFRHIRK